MTRGINDPRSTQESPAQNHAPRQRAIGLTTLLVAVAALYFGRELLIPLFVAALLAFLLAPAVRLLERTKVGRVLSVLVVTALGLGVVLGVGWIVVSQAASLASDIPRYRQNLASKIQDLRSTADEEVKQASEAVEELSRALESGPEGAAAGESGDSAEAEEGRGAAGGRPGDEAAVDEVIEPAPPPPVKVEVVQSTPEYLRWMGGFLAPVLYPLATFGISAVFVVFFLIHREDLRDRLLRLSGQASINVTTTALAESATRVTRYLWSLALVNAMTGVAIAIGLYFIGVPNALLWGLLASLLRFIPLVGPWMAAVFPLAVSISLLEGWTQPLLVALLFITLEMLSGNLLEPWLYGSRIGLSPVAVLFAFVFWVWLWGAVGLLLAMPITVCLVVVGKLIPVFEPFYILLGNESVLEPATRFYQRMLARDRAEVLKIGHKALHDRPFAEGCDEVILPALAQVERDHRDNLIDDQRLEFAIGAIRALIEKEGKEEEEEEEEGSAKAKSTGPDVLLVPLDGVLARCSAELLAEAMNAVARPEITGERVLVSEVASMARDRRPAALVLVAVEPWSSRRLGYVCKRVISAAPDCPILVMVATARSSVTRERRALERLGGNIRVVVSARELIGALSGSGLWPKEVRAGAA